MKRTIKLHTGATKVVEDATHKIMTIQEWREEKDVLVRTTWIGSLSALCADILHQSGILKRPEPKDQTVPARSALEDIRERGPRRREMRLAATGWLMDSLVSRMGRGLLSWMKKESERSVLRLQDRRCSHARETYEAL